MRAGTATAWPQTPTIALDIDWPDCSGAPIRPHRVRPRPVPARPACPRECPYGGEAADMDGPVPVRERCDRCSYTTAVLEETESAAAWSRRCPQAPGSRRLTRCSQPQETAPASAIA